MARTSGRSGSTDVVVAGAAMRRVLPWLLLLGAAAALRWLQWTRTVTLFNDGPLLLDAAHSVASGDWRALFAQPHHPLYPLTIAAGHGLGFEAEGSAALVSVLGGTAGIAFACLFFRDAFGARAAWIASGLLVVHARAVEYASDVQTDGLYFGLFAGGIWLAWRAWTRASARAAAASGILAGLAYLTRPEGLGITALVVALAAFAALRGTWPARRAMAVAGAAAIATAIVAAPYVVALQASSGTWALTQKKSVQAMAGLPVTASQVHSPHPAPIAPHPPAPGGRRDVGADGLAVSRADSAPARAAAAAKMLARTARSAFRYGALALLLPGLWVARGRPGARATFLIVLGLLYAGVLYALTLQQGYVSRRHALPPLVPFFGYVGLGALAIGAWAARVPYLRRFSPLGLAVAAAGCVAIGELATQREPRRSEERAARAAAEWLHAKGARGVLVTDRLRLGYYAGMPYVPFVRSDAVTLRSYLDQADAHWVLLDDPDDVALLEQAAGDRLRLLHRAEDPMHDGRNEAWVYRIDPIDVLDTGVPDVPPPPGTTR